MCAPHPAALTTIASTPASSKASMVARASARARSGAPAWAWCAAAALGARDRHLRALAHKTADGRLVVRAEDRVLHAAVKQPDALPPRATRRDHLGEDRAALPGAAGGAGTRMPRGSAGRAAGGRSPGRAAAAAPLVGAKRTGHQAEQARARQQAVERGAPH